MVETPKTGPEGPRSVSLLGKVQGAEKAFLSGRRKREDDLESAVAGSLSHEP